MKANKFNEEFFAAAREMEVWKMLFDDRDFIWTETLIDRYHDRIDWKKLSGNGNMQWTTSMLEKYKDKIDWEILSDGSYKYLYSVENLKKYSSRWNWKNLSSNSYVGWTEKKVEEFKDLIDWDSFISSYGNDDLFTIPFFEKYKEYIPAASLQGSPLWHTILEIYKIKLIKEILSQ